MRYYRLSAGQDDPKGLNNLGLCLLTGSGVEADPNEAFDCFRRSAERGSPQALYNLGYCWEYGKGTERDLNRAVACYRSAAAGGSDPARKALERLEGAAPQ